MCCDELRGQPPVRIDLLCHRESSFESSHKVLFNSQKWLAHRVHDGKELTDEKLFIQYVST